MNTHNTALKQDLFDNDLTKGKVEKMKSLKRSLAIMLIAVCMLSTAVPALALGAKDFSDVKENDWFYHNIDLLVQFHMISGYPDGTFHPNNDITVAEYIKTLISFKYKQQSTPQGHWATNYMAKAEEYGLVDVGEYPQESWDKPITRQQMINIAYKYIVVLCGESPEPDGYVAGIDTREYFISKISDWDSIPDAYKDYVLTTYYKGIVTGYEDGTFRGEGTATRAEACAIILRTTSSNERIPFSIDLDSVS